MFTLELEKTAGRASCHRDGESVATTDAAKHSRGQVDFRVDICCVVLLVYEANDESVSIKQAFSRIFDQFVNYRLRCISR